MENKRTFSIKSLEWIESRLHDLGGIELHSLTVDCDTFSNEKEVAVAIQ